MFRFLRRKTKETLELKPPNYRFVTEVAYNGVLRNKLREHKMYKKYDLWVDTDWCLGWEKIKIHYESRTTKEKGIIYYADYESSRKWTYKWMTDDIKLKQTLIDALRKGGKRKLDLTKNEEEHLNSILTLAKLSGWSLEDSEVNGSAVYELKLMDIYMSIIIYYESFHIHCSNIITGQIYGNEDWYSYANKESKIDFMNKIINYI